MSDTLERRHSSAPLRVKNLSVGYKRHGQDPIPVVRDVSFDLHAGEILGVAGESGCGKSTLSLAAIGFRGGGVEILGGSAHFGDSDLVTLPYEKRRMLWGTQIAYVTQNAGMSLNPSFTVGRMLDESLSRVSGIESGEREHRRLELLRSVELPANSATLSRYAHEFSGGQQQRIALAIALATKPRVLLLDEPTTGLDPTTQVKISRLLRDLVEEHQISGMYVSHDLALLSNVTDQVLVMYAGEVVEQTAGRLRREATVHPYSRALVGALPDPQRAVRLVGIAGEPPTGARRDGCQFAPRCAFAVASCATGSVDLVSLPGGHQARCSRLADLPVPGNVAVRASQRDVARSSILQVDDVAAQYAGTATPVLTSVSFALGQGERLGVLGESGSGKSTLLRVIAGLHPAAAGSLTMNGERLMPHIARRSAQQKRGIQMVFQNADSALNPRHTVRQLIQRAVRLLGDEPNARAEALRIDELLSAVKLSTGIVDRYPGELSGGQKQRVALARALASRPAVLLCDEVTSALDVSVQATTIDLILALSDEFHTAVVFVSHDLGLVRSFADRVMVLRNGRIAEQGDTETVFSSPESDYTAELIGAAQVLT